MTTTNRKPNLTALETKLLRNIALNDYQPTNGSEPESFAQTSAVWSNCLDCGPESIEARQLPALVSSLLKKGLIWQDGKGKEATIALTQAGWDAYVEIRNARNLAASGAVAR